MKKIFFSIIVGCIICIGIYVYIQIHTQNGPTSSVIKTEIGDFKEVLKLSVLDVDIQDAYPVEVNGKTVIYKIPAHCEFKYDLEKVSLNENDSSIIVTLPRCVPEITTEGETPTILYEEEALLSIFLDNNVSDAEDSTTLKMITDSIKERVEKDYQDLAFDQAKVLLENFYSNIGKEVVIKESNDSVEFSN